MGTFILFQIVDIFRKVLIMDSAEALLQRELQTAGFLFFFFLKSAASLGLPAWGKKRLSASHTHLPVEKV